MREYSSMIQAMDLRVGVDVRRRNVALRPDDVVDLMDEAPREPLELARRQGLGIDRDSPPLGAAEGQVSPAPVFQVISEASPCASSMSTVGW